MVQSLVKTALALAIAAAASACAPPNPTIARDPVAAPAAGYKVACESKPFILNAYITSCAPVEAVRVRERKTTVVKAKG